MANITPTLIKGDRVLNFEFMSGDRTFKNQSDRTFKSQNDRAFNV
jgi:hypothetical protein